MAEICCEVLKEGENSVLSSSCESTSSRVARRRRMEIRRFKYVAGVSGSTDNDDDGGGGDSEIIDGTKRQRMEVDNTSSFPRECTRDVENCVSDKRVREIISAAAASSDGSDEKDNNKCNGHVDKKNKSSLQTTSICQSLPSVLDIEIFSNVPKFGVASVCGRRRDMEDAVSVHPSFFRSSENSVAYESHYFAVYDGHGCSHVAMRCRERLHELVKEELLLGVTEWKMAMEKSFDKMDKEVIEWNEGVVNNCRCELQTPECDAVGSTAVVAIVTPQNIVVANCGDSRAVLCRNGQPFPLSSDHKPDRPDELKRIQEAGGRVIYWDGPRVLGVLAMSRAIGDYYLKPYVSCEPEVTITNRSAEDDCLIIASDGLWDVVSNDTACGVARMCLRGKVPPATLTPEVEQITSVGEGMADKACSDASMLLTKLALARRSTDNVSVVVIDLRKDT
ncbi:putative protein phosphatase 2C 24 [Bienertia sinuspersici]